MASILKCRRGFFPFKYLGLQVGANMNLVKHWKPVVDTFKKRLSVWKQNSLSYGGRITLIKSVMNSLPTYYFSLFKAPKQVIHELERLRREFLWGGSTEQHRINWVAWCKVTKPKELGGIGIGSLKETNMAMLAKWWWRYKTESVSIWKKVIWSFHNNARSWSFIPAKMTAPGPWKQVVSIGQDFSALDIDLTCLFQLNLGDGKDVSFWKDRWITPEPLCTMFPLLYGLEQAKNVKVAERLKVESGLLVFCPSWNRTPSSSDETLELDILICTICSAELSSGGDRWVWALDETKRFTVRSLRKHMQLKGGSEQVSSFYWNNWSPTKVNFLSWRIDADRIPTKIALARRNIVVGDVRCSLCGIYEETTDHLFALCQFAQRIWEMIALWCKIYPLIVFGAKDVLQLKDYLSGSKKWKKAIHMVVQTALWSIWRCRNERVFSGKHMNGEQVFGEIRAVAFLWFKSRAKVPSLTWQQWVAFDLTCLCV
ncbi:putative reverse transcriptase zinc-binding domain-containing protein [Helianthus annuus]|nr:putative reverse transcriptase zinc-binding domain-containing protein [Helianthus annuus]KAJ0881458.1 putative reverse transcriptase zinc-binding domain-containing protein [Helianthus annuus]